MGLAALLLLVVLVPTQAVARPVDAIAVSAQACTITGDEAADRLAGSPTGDVVCGRGGGDRLQGKAGPDRLDGGQGNDNLFGGAGADDLRGGPGNDGLGGGLGPDDLSGGTGRDIAFYGQRARSVRVSIGTGTQDGVAGERDNVRGDVEDVQGGRGNDVLTGNGRSNRLFGGGGRDRLRGRGGNDLLMGGGGNDRVDARDGAGSIDRIGCGGGQDTALVDPGDRVDPDCENVVGGAPSPPSNNAPTGIALSNASVAENEPAGTTVGTLSAGDPDPGDTHAFALVPGAGSTDNGSFEIAGSTLRTAAAFDYEAKSSYSVRIRATDFGTPAGEIVREFTITVTNVNEGPTITTTAGALAYAEGDGPTAVDGGLTVTDDSASLAGATVRLSAGFESADELLFTDQNGITGTYDTGTGVLTLTGTSSLANYQDALRSVEYQHTGDDPAITKTVTFQADDGGGLGSASARDIDVTPVNDAPTVDASAGSASFTEGGGPVAVDPGVLVNDPDSAMLTGATVSIAPVLAEDSLGFANQLGITGSYNAATGVLTLSGTTTVANYQAALRSVNYDNSASNPSTAARTVSFAVTDAGGLASTADTRDVTVTAANTTPTITTTAGALVYTEGDASTVVDSGLTVTDLDDVNLEGAQVRISAGFEPADELPFTNQLGITGSYNAGTGVLTLTGTSSLANYQTALRSVQYEHTGDNPAISKTVEFRADDGDGLGPASTRNIAVTRVNDDPTITTTGADLAYTENAAPVAIDGGLTLTDPDSAEISGATVTISSNFQSAQDDLGFVDQNGITGAYNDATGVLTLFGTTSAANYQTALRSVTYVNVSEGPAPLTRTISFQASDVEGAAGNTATRGIAITSLNDPPTAVNDTGTTDEDTTLNVVGPGVLANDSDLDPGDTKTVDRLNGSAILTGASAEGAAVTINADGSYTYNPGSIFQSLSTGQSDTDSFTYRMSDGGGASATATVTLTITGVSDAPTANPDSFDAIGNTALSLGTSRPAGEAGKVITGSVVSNDTDPDTPQGNLVVTAGTFPTALGGTIEFETDGNFTYHPDDGDVGVTDTVQYTVSDGVANSNGTLSLPLAGQVWYVQNNELAGGDGTSDTPFDTLAEAETASGTGDTVYVFDGNNTSANLDTGFAMEANERLIGEHNGVSLAGHLLHAGTTNAHPTLTASNEDVVAMASGSTLDGFNVDPSGTGGGISASAGAVTITDVNVADGGTAGTQPGVDLDGTSGTSNVSDLTVSTSGATGVRLNNAGTTDFGTTTITSAGAPGLTATNTNMGTSTFGAITVTGSGNGGVSLNGTSGTTTFGDLSLTTTTGTAPAFALSSAGTISVPPADTANLSATGGPAVDVTGTSGATLAFDAVSSTASAGDGINLAGLGAGTFSAASGTITGAAGIAFDLDGGSGTVTYPGALNNGSGATAEITGRTGGAVTLSGAIADTNDAGGGITLSGNTGGSTTFSNASKDLDTGTGNAVVMGTSDGHTLTLSGGGLDIDATTGAGIDATNSGTLIVTGAGNAINTTTGRALNVSATDIGTGGLAFQTISTNGAPSGITLNNTGATAGLTVAGNGGSCTSAATCTGGAIQSSTGAGIDLTSVGGGVNLTRMSVNNGGDDGIRGSGVAGLNLTNLNVAANGNAVGEQGIDLAQLTGSGSMANTTVTGSADRNVRIANTSGTLSAFNVTAATVTANSIVTGDDGFLVENNGTGSMAVSITGSTFTDNKGDHFDAATDADATGSLAVTFSNNTLTTTPANDPNVIGGGITISPSGSADLTFAINDNNVQQAFDEGINLNLGTAATAAASMIGTLSGNTVGNAAEVDSGSESGTGINVTSNGAGTTTVAVTNNDVFQYANPYGILLNHKEGSSTMNATVTGNTVANPGTFAINGVRVDSGATASDTGTICAAVLGNTLAGSGLGADTDVRLRQRFGTTIRLPGYGGASSDTDAVNAFVAANNPGADVSSVHNVGGGGGGFVGGAACATP